MGSKPFQFKQFSVAQHRTTHKVGTDGVLLGAWVNIRHEDKLVLDIGTGSGLIALMMAQRTGSETHIDAIEAQAADAQQAKENVARSPWKEKMTVYEGPVQNFFPDKQYDLIISNPPFFVNSQPPPEKKRCQARHTYKLSFEDLAHSVVRLLTKNGRFALVLPQGEAQVFLKLARGFKLFPIRKTNFRTRANKPVERLLLELAHGGACETETEIVLYAEGEAWSEEYRRLTGEFYLNI